MSIKLNQLPIGNTAVIHTLLGDNVALHRQCGVLGLKLGERIEVLHRSRGNGPMQVKCRGTLFAIRNDEAASISVVMDA